MPPKGKEQKLDRTNDLLDRLVTAVTTLAQRVEDLESGRQTGQTTVKRVKKAFDPTIHADSMYYIRIKPYNERLGHLRRRQYVKELGRIVNGGTGNPGDIPEWVEISGAQAVQLAKYRQDDNDPRSPQVFDIVDEEEKSAIEQAEASIRMSVLGISGLPPTQVLAAAQRAAAAATRRAGARTPDVISRERPSVMDGAATYQYQEGAPVEAQAPAVRKGAVDRSAALEGLEDAAVDLAVPDIDLPPAPPPPPPSKARARPGVDEDIAASVDEEELAEVGKDIALARTVRGVTGSVSLP